MNISSASSSQTSYLRQLKEIDIQSKPGQLHIQTGIGELSVDLREPQLDINLDAVWDSIGLQKPSAFTESAKQGYQRDYAEDIARVVSEGRKIAKDIAAGNDKLYSQMVTRRYMEDHAVEFEVGLMPEASPDISIQIHLPVIQYEVNFPKADAEFPELRVTLKPAGSTASIIDQRV